MYITLILASNSGYLGTAKNDGGIKVYSSLKQNYFSTIFVFIFFLLGE